jgi:hypothetical protein
VSAAPIADTAASYSGSRNAMTATGMARKKITNRNIAA